MKKNKSIRISVVVPNQEQLETWKKFRIANNFSNNSQMIRFFVNDGIKRFNEPIDKSFQPLLDKIEVLYKLTMENNDYLEIIKLKLAGHVENSEVRKAAKEILQYIAQNGDIYSQSEIYSKFNYKRDVIDGALSLLIDLGIKGTIRKNFDEQNKNGDENNE